MYKIDYDENLQIDLKELYDNYNDHLDKDLRKIFKKLLNQKPEFITDEEGDKINEFYYYIETLVETIGEIRLKLDLID
jgi:hypothetical protein